MTDSRFSLDCVDAQALYHSLRRSRDKNDGSGYGLIDAQLTDSALTFTVDRYAMDSSGGHVGTEQYTAYFKVEPSVGFPGRPPASQGFIILDRGFDLAIEPAQEPIEYTLADALSFLSEYGEGVPIPGSVSDDEIIQEAHDRGMGEGDYSPPDQDFGYQYVQPFLDEALDDLPEWRFDWGSPHEWRLSFLEIDLTVAIYDLETTELETLA